MPIPLDLDCLCLPQASVENDAMAKQIQKAAGMHVESDLSKNAISNTLLRDWFYVCRYKTAEQNICHILEYFQQSLLHCVP